MLQKNVGVTVVFYKLKHSFIVLRFAHTCMV